jgi:hypothetical protein
MEEFGTIEKLRQGNSFVERNYARYRDRLRQEIRKQKESEMRTTYKLELNLAKFLVLKSRNFLRSSLRILRKHKSRFSTLYGIYIANILRHSTDGTVNINELLKLREELIDYGSFVEHIDLIIETSSSDFDVSSLKLRHRWNDISIAFDTRRERSEFLEGRPFSRSDKYDLVLANLVMGAEKRKEQLFGLIRRGPGRIGCILKKIERMRDAFSRLSVFLQDNLSPSTYVEQVLKDVQWLHSYYSRINEYVSCTGADEGVEVSPVPESLGEIKDKIAEGRASARINSRSAKAAMLKYLEESLGPRPSHIAMPFIPVFYDIAFDYISYPAENKKVSELFGKLHLHK